MEADKFIPSGGSASEKHMLRNPEKGMNMDGSRRFV
jgi:hypothetical protein